MEQREFNLLEEPWIRVMRPDCTVEELSLPDALCRAQDYRALGGELPTQDVAVLRLLLAVLHTVFSRVDEDGQPAPLEEPSDALRRWKTLWNRGSFPEHPIRDYLAAWHDRFWLFDPEQPFYQVPEAGRRSPFGAEKLNGELSESGNKDRVKVFQLRGGKEKSQLSYGEAARWLVSLIAFDDAASTKASIGAGAGWLGRIGNTYATGENLFETLLLNLTLLKDGILMWEEENSPAWERDDMHLPGKREIAVPDNQAALLTLQSRRITLKRSNDYVIGFDSAGGDYFSSEGAFSEQMTLWHKVQDKHDQLLTILPKKHEPSRQAWRDFSLFVPCGQDDHPLGVAQWIYLLQRRGIIARRRVHFATTGVCYDRSGGSITDVIYDHLDFNIDLLTGETNEWTHLIQDQINVCEKASNFVWTLADSLYKAAGCYTEDEKGKEKRNFAKENFYTEIDIPFRNWLMAIDPKDGEDEDTRDRTEAQWRHTAYRIARKLGQKMVEQAGDVAYAGRELTEKIKGKEAKRYYSSPLAFNIFTSQIKKCFEIEA